MSTAAQVRAALALASEVGAYFAVDDEIDDGWHPLRELVEAETPLTDRVEFARSFLSQRTGAEVELRACASINSLGVLSRVVAPALATATLAGVVPALDLDIVSWRPVDGGPLPVAFGATTGRSVADAAQAAEAIVELVIEPALRPVLEAYRERFLLSPQTLWGNVASALNGAAGMFAATTIDPVGVVAALLARAPLAGAGHYESFGGRRFFVRDNCCLFYRVPPGGKCGDCVLVPEAARHDQWRTAFGR